MICLVQKENFAFQELLSDTSSFISFKKSWR